MSLLRKKTSTRFSKFIGKFLLFSFSLQSCNLNTVTNKMKSDFEFDNTTLECFEEIIPEQVRISKRKTRKVKQLMNNSNNLNINSSDTDLYTIANDHTNIYNINSTLSFENMLNTSPEKEKVQKTIENNNNAEKDETIQKEKESEIKSPVFSKKSILLLLAGSIIGSGITFSSLYFTDLTKINEIKKDESYYQDELNKCNDYLVGNASAFSTLNYSLITCDNKLTSYASNLATCNTDLANSNTYNNTCSTNLATCTASLNTTNSNLATCNTDLANSNTANNTCNTNLATCTVSLNTTNSNLATCNTDLASSNTDNNTCNTNLATCTTSLNTTNSNLATCNTNLATTNDSLALYTSPPPSLLCAGLTNFFTYVVTGNIWEQTHGKSCGPCSGNPIICTTCYNVQGNTFSDCFNCTYVPCANSCGFTSYFYSCSGCNSFP